MKNRISIHSEHLKHGLYSTPSRKYLKDSIKINTLRYKHKNGSTDCDT